MPKYRVTVADETDEKLYERSFEAEGPTDVFAMALADVWAKQRLEKPDLAEPAEGQTLPIAN